MSVSKSSSDELTDPKGAGGVGEFRWAPQIAANSSEGIDKGGVQLWNTRLFAELAGDPGAKRVP
jgi:hypothetical protein